MDSYDVTIIGSGITGSVVGLILSKLGYKTLMVEKSRHPRFALGESSTPIFSQKIRHLGRTYAIPELVEVSSYDRIKAWKDPAAPRVELGARERGEAVEEDLRHEARDERDRDVVRRRTREEVRDERRGEHRQHGDRGESGERDGEDR